MMVAFVATGYSFASPASGMQALQNAKRSDAPVKRVSSSSKIERYGCEDQRRRSALNDPPGFTRPPGRALSTEELVTIIPNSSVHILAKVTVINGYDDHYTEEFLPDGKWKVHYASAFPFDLEGRWSISDDELIIHHPKTPSRLHQDERNFVTLRRQVYLYNDTYFLHRFRFFREGESFRDTQPSNYYWPICSKWSS